MFQIQCILLIIFVILSKITTIINGIIDNNIFIKEIIKKNSIINIVEVNIMKRIRGNNNNNNMNNEIIIWILKINNKIDNNNLK